MGGDESPAGRLGSGAGEGHELVELARMPGRRLGHQAFLRELGGDELVRLRGVIAESRLAKGAEIPGVEGGEPRVARHVQGAAGEKGMSLMARMLCHGKVPRAESPGARPRPSRKRRRKL